LGQARRPAGGHCARRRGACLGASASARCPGHGGPHPGTRSVRAAPPTLIRRWPSGWPCYHRVGTLVRRVLVTWRRNGPTYAYACTACEHQFDTVQKFTDPSLTDCPVCAGQLRKLFSSVGIVFKGSGFYRTDSRVSSSDKPSSNGTSDGKATSSAPESAS